MTRGLELALVADKSAKAKNRAHKKYILITMVAYLTKAITLGLGACYLAPITNV